MEYLESHVLQEVRGPVVLLVLVSTARVDPDADLLAQRTAHSTQPDST